MNDQLEPELPVPFGAFNPLLLPVVVLLLPIVLTLCLAGAARYSQRAGRRVWAAYRCFHPLILISTVAGWWVTWDSADQPALISKVFSGWLDRSSAEILLFWALPTVNLGAFLVLSKTNAY